MTESVLRLKKTCVLALILVLVGCVVSMGPNGTFEEEVPYSFSNVTFIDNGFPPVDVGSFISSIFAAVFSLCSAFVSGSVFLLFYFGVVSIFPSDTEPVTFEGKKIGVVLREMWAHLNVLQSPSKNTNTSSIISERRNFISRIIMTVSVANFLFSLTRLFQVLWLWLCNWGIPDFMFDTDIYTSSINGTVGQEVQYFPSNIGYFTSFLFAAAFYSLSMAAATWSVIFALSIFMTTVTFGNDHVDDNQIPYYTPRKKQGNFKMKIIELLFHGYTWGISLTSFIVLTLVGAVSLNKGEDLYLEFRTAISFVWAGYFTITLVATVVILLLIWRNLGKHYSSKEELVIPHEETRRKQRAIVLRLSLYMLPYVLVGIVELMYWYGTAVTSTFLDGSNLAYIFFNSFVFNIIVPLKGFLNGLVFILGSPVIRSFSKYLVKGGWFRVYLTKRSLALVDTRKEHLLDNDNQLESVNFGRLN